MFSWVYGYKRGNIITQGDNFGGQGVLVVDRGASTVKWTTLDPCSSLSKSYPKLYTNFEFYAIEILKHLEKYESTKTSNLCSQKNNIKQCIFILEDGASGEQVGDIEKIIVKNLFKI